MPTQKTTAGVFADHAGGVGRQPILNRQGLKQSVAIAAQAVQRANPKIANAILVEAEDRIRREPFPSGVGLDQAVFQPRHTAIV